MYQIATLSGLLLYGVGWLEFDVPVSHAVTILATVLLAQFAATRLSGRPGFDPRSALISGLSLCLLLRTNSLTLAVLTAARGPTEFVPLVLSVYTYLWYDKWLTWALLIGSALVDGVLYLLVGDAIVCYRCGAHHRGIPKGSPHAPFEITIGERYRQERIRRERMKAQASPK